MSDTYRAVQPGWGPGKPDFERLFPGMTRKRHTADRASGQPARHERFRRYGRKSLHRLRRENERLHCREAQEIA
jgi:hypothetical protein